MVMAPWSTATLERIPYHILKAFVVGHDSEQTIILINFVETTYLGGLTVKPSKPLNKIQEVIKHLQLYAAMLMDVGETNTQVRV